MGISAGRLRERVIIQGPVGVPDGAGGRSTDWVDIARTAQVWAEVIPLNGGEALRAGVQRATQFYRVTIRYRDDVLPRNRLMWRGQALNIKTCADPDGRREALLMTVESGVPDA